MGSPTTTQVKNLKLSDAIILSKDLAISSNYDASSSKIVTETDLGNAIAGLGQALSYAGVADQDPATTKVTTVNTGTSVTIKAGNVVSYGTKEYLCIAVDGSGNQTWKEFGDEGAFVVKNTAITPVTTATLLKITYDAKGLVTGSSAAEKADIPGMSDKVETSTTIAGNALTGNISADTLRTSLGVSAGANKVEASETNGNIKIDGTETTVYTEVANTVHDANYAHITVTSSTVSDGTTTLDISSLESASHTHSNKALLDTYTQTEANLADAVSKKHAHDANAVDITSTVKSGYDTSKASFDAKDTACAALEKLDVTTNVDTTVTDIANKVDAIIDALQTAAS